MSKLSHNQQKPLARAEGLLHSPLNDELVIYDMERHKAHSLNRIAALVWKHCDGQTTVQALGQLLAHELPERIDEQIVWLSLQQLDRSHLLQERLQMPDNLLSRREAAKRFGKIVGLVLPLVASTLIPPAIAAGTCLASGQPCSTGAQCCSSICASNFCA